MVKNIPNGRKIYEIEIEYTYKHLPLQDPPKFTQIWIFGLKIPIPSGNPAAAVDVGKRRSLEKSEQSWMMMVIARDARWQIFKPKIPILGIFLRSLEWITMVYF
jgi:hypothetical protein